MLARKSTACSSHIRLKSMQKVRKICTSGQQKQGRCAGSQRISFGSEVKMEFRFNRKFLSSKQTITIFSDENNKPEPLPTAETKPGLDLWWSLKSSQRHALCSKGRWKTKLSSPEATSRTSCWFCICVLHCSSKLHPCFSVILICSNAIHLPSWWNEETSLQ